MNSGNIYGVSGVAPDAELYVYRTFGCDGDAANSREFRSLALVIP